jgi:hypothetical protein
MSVIQLFRRWREGLMEEGNALGYRSFYRDDHLILIFRVATESPY